MSGFAIVTGGSRGIGRATVEALRREGWRVAAVARSAPALEALRSASGAIPKVADAADPDAFRSAIAALVEEHGPCGILVNNAGYGLRGAVEEIDLDAWRRQFEVNLFAVAAATQVVMPGMRAAGRGVIVNVGSVAGRVSTPLSGAYSATKFALRGLTDALRLEVAPWGVHVVLVEPGPVSTAFAESASAASERVLGRAESPYAPVYRRFAEHLRTLHASSAWTEGEVAGAMVRAALAPAPPRTVRTYGFAIAGATWLSERWPVLFGRLASRRMGLDGLVRA